MADWRGDLSCHNIWLNAVPFLSEGWSSRWLFGNATVEDSGKPCFKPLSSKSNDIIDKAASGAPYKAGVIPQDEADLSVEECSEDEALPIVNTAFGFVGVIGVQRTRSSSSSMNRSRVLGPALVEVIGIEDGVSGALESSEVEAEELMVAENPKGIFILMVVEKYAEVGRVVGECSLILCKAFDGVVRFLGLRSS